MDVQERPRQETKAGGVQTTDESFCFRLGMKDLRREERWDRVEKKGGWRVKERRTLETREREEGRRRVEWRRGREEVVEEK